MPQGSSQPLPRTLNRTLRERVGGRWAVSVPGTSLIVAWSILAFLLTETGASAGQLPAVLIAATLSAAAIVPVLALASVTVLRNRRNTPAPVWMVVLVGVAAGVARSTVAYLAVDFFTLPSATPYWSRAVTGALLGAIYVPLIAYLSDSWEQFSQERSRLLSVLAAEETAASDDRLYLQTLRSALLTDILERLNSALTEARDAIDLPDTDGTTVTALRRAADLDVRRTSHTLWVDEVQKSRLRLRDLVTFMAHTRPFYPTWALIPVVVAAFFPLVRLVGWMPSIAVLLTGSAYVFAVMLVANFACNKWDRFAIRIFWVSEAALFLSGMVVAESMRLIGGVEDVPTLIQWGLISAFAATLLGTLTGAVPAVAQKAEQALESLRQAVDQAEVSALASQIEAQKVRRDVARYLHGTVRANLTVIAMRLETALAEGDAVSVTALTEEARECLKVDMSTQLTRRDVDLSSSMSELQALWAGILSITYNLYCTPESLPRYTARAVVDLVTEAVHDAARHARATTVMVNVFCTGQLISIQVDNDGAEPDGNATPGLGTRTLDTLSPGAWSLIRLDSGLTRLTATLAIL